MPIRENKFARQAQQRAQRAKGNTAVRDNQPTIEEQLARLEEDIRRLKIEFDIYFNGASKRPPYDTKSRVETLIKRIADDRTLTFAQRFQYNSLVARYTSFRELWRRTMQGREEGRDPATAARAAAHIEAVDSGERSTFVCADAHRDVETVKNLYAALVEARRRCGDRRPAVPRTQIPLQIDAAEGKLVPRIPTTTAHLDAARRRNARWGW